MKEIKDLTVPTAVLTLICLVIAVAMVLTYQITAPLIEATAKAKSDAARAQVLPAADSFTQLTDVPLEEGVLEVYQADNGVGYVITTVDKGYGGEIKFLVALNMNGEIMGIKVLSHTETPGLGTKVMKPEHIEQYLNKTKVEGISAIAGVTISSKAMERGVQKALNQSNVLKGVI